MSRGALSPQEIENGRISDIYLIFDSARRLPTSNIKKGEFVFEISQRGIQTKQLTGVLINNDTLSNVIEMEVCSLYLPELPVHATINQTEIDHYSLIATPGQVLPPLVIDTLPPDPNAMQQILNYVISMEIQESYPQISSTVTSKNITFMFEQVNSPSTGNYLRFKPYLSSKYIFTTPKNFLSTLTLKFKSPYKDIEFNDDVLYNAKTNFTYFNPPQVVPYANTTGLVTNQIFFSGIYDYLHNKVYFAPYDDPVLYYVFTQDNTIINYVNNSGIPILGPNAYDFGVFTSKGFIYWTPFSVSDLPVWHFVNTNNDEVGVYGVYPIGGITDPSFALPQFAFSDIVLNADESRAYLIPLEPLDYLFYIRLSDSTVHAYPNTMKSTMVSLAYSNGVLTKDGLIFMCPLLQQNEPAWHYIDTNTNTIYMYRNNTGLPQNLIAPWFKGLVYVPNSTRIYLVPSYIAGDDYWFYIDTVGKIMIPFFNTAVPRPNATETSYNGGVWTPDNRVYFIPSAQADEQFWHYVDNADVTTHAYPNTAFGNPNAPVSEGYYGGVVTLDTQIYMVPYNQTIEPFWHYIDLGQCTISFYYPNHGLIGNEVVNIENFTSTNSAITNYINREIGLIVSANNTDADNIFFNPFIDVQHNSVKLLNFAKPGTYSNSVNIIIPSRRFSVFIRFRILNDKVTNGITPS